MADKLRPEPPAPRQENPFRKYQRDPKGYARDVLNVELTPDQVEMLESIRDNRYTLAKASHAVGKTFTAAIACCWWYDCWDEHIAYITGPNWAQALGLTFKQVKSFRRDKLLPGRILETGRVLDDDLAREPAHFIRALNSDTGEGFQGEHSAPILIVVEEGVGVPHYIWEAMRGLMTHPDCRVFAIGNPTEESNDFGDAASNPRYKVFSLSALEHPNISAELRCAPPPFPKAVSLQWLYEMLSDEAERTDVLEGDAIEFYALPVIEAALRGVPVTEESEQWFYLPTGDFQGRVLGEFPTQTDEQVIPRGWLKYQPRLDPGEDDFPEVGCDIAHKGNDRTGVGTRWGPCFMALVELRKMDTVLVTQALRDAAAAAALMWLKRQGYRPEDDHEGRRLLLTAKRVPTKIDVTGGLGSGPADTLRREGYTVIPVNSSSKPNNKEQFKNKRSELWFDTRVRAREKRLDLSRLPKDIRDRLVREWGAPKYDILSGKKVVEEKKVTKKKLGQSPDLADTGNLTFAVLKGGTHGRVEIFNVTTNEDDNDDEY